MNWLNYHHLFYFYTIAQEGGVARAAEKLRLGQPTLSTQLKQFEENLGTKLFDRNKRHLVLTETGRIALRYASEIFKLGAEFIETVKEQRIPNLIHLRVGSLDSIPKNSIFALTEAAHQEGKCFISVTEGPSDFLMRELNAHRIDLVLTNSSAPVGPGSTFQSRLVGEVPVAVYGAKNFNRLKKNFPKSLEGQPFVVPTAHSKLRRDLEHYFETQNVHPRIITETQDSALQKLMVKAGRALAALPRSIVEDLLVEGHVTRLGVLEHVTESVWLSGIDRKIQNPIAAKLFDKFSL